MKDIRQSRNYANYLSSIGWKVIKKNNLYYFIKKIFFITTIKLQRPERLRYKDIEILSKKYKGLVNFIIEPKNNDQFSMINFQKTNPYLPSRTLILDLTKTKEEIFSNFSKDARYALRKVQNAKLKIKNCSNLDLFHQSWKYSVPFLRVVLSLENLIKLKKAFGDNALFLLNKNAGLPRQSAARAGAIFLVANNTGYYWQAFTNNEGRKSLIQYSIVWEGIKWCKKRGAKYFDFEGIFDERFPLKTWKGFTGFKKKFGGEEREFPGAYQKWFVNL